MHLLNKNINFNKTKRSRKWKIPRTVLERRTLCLSSCKNRKLKVKLWWVRACERKKRAFSVYSGIFLRFLFYLTYSVLNTCSEYTYSLHIKKHYFIHLCCLLLESSKALFSVSLSKLDLQILASNKNEAVYLRFLRTNIWSRSWCLRDLNLSRLIKLCY